MLSILHNSAAWAAQNQLSMTNTALQQTLVQLASGRRINSGADDAAGLSIADGLNANIASLTQSALNANEGISQLQVADGALSQVTSLLNRAVTLSTEAANGGLTSTQQTALDNEFTSIKKEIDSIGQTTTYNGTVVFSGSGTQPNLNVLEGSGALNPTDVVNPANGGGGPSQGTILLSNSALYHWGNPAGANTPLASMADASGNHYVGFGQTITIAGDEGGNAIPPGVQLVGGQAFATSGTL